MMMSTSSVPSSLLNNDALVHDMTIIHEGTRVRRDSELFFKTDYV